MDILLILPILLMSAVVHEVMHGLAAYWLGDPTAKYMGRLTLNPLKHLDPFGSVLFPLLLILFRAPIFLAWAKPVPYNPYNLRDQKYGPAIVGAAGPLSNIIIALIFGISLKILLLAKVFPLSDIHAVLGSFFSGVSMLGAGVSGIVIVFSLIIIINILLAMFNLIPFPPLDGSKLLFAVLPVREETKIYMEQYGLMFLFPFIIIFSGPIFMLIRFVQLVFFKVVVGI